MYDMHQHLGVSPSEWRKMYPYQRMYFIERWNEERAAENKEMEAKVGEGSAPTPTDTKIDIGKMAKGLYSKIGGR